MEQSGNKTIVKILFFSFLAFLIAYFVDQYYIYKRELYFLSKPIQTINTLSIFNFQ